MIFVAEIMNTLPPPEASRVRLEIRISNAARSKSLLIKKIRIKSAWFEWGVESVFWDLTHL